MSDMENCNVTQDQSAPLEEPQYCVLPTPNPDVWWNTEFCQELLEPDAQDILTMDLEVSEDSDDSDDDSEVSVSPTSSDIALGEALEKKFLELEAQDILAMDSEDYTEDSEEDSDDSDDDSEVSLSPTSSDIALGEALEKKFLELEAQDILAMDSEDYTEDSEEDSDDSDDDSEVSVSPTSSDIALGEAVEKKLLELDAQDIPTTEKRKRGHPTDEYERNNKKPKLEGYRKW